MSPQERANDLLQYWQTQRQMGIKAEDRRLLSDDELRDLKVIRQCLERKI